MDGNATLGISVCTFGISSASRSTCGVRDALLQCSDNCTLLCVLCATYVVLQVKLLEESKTEALAALRVCQASVGELQTEVLAVNSKVHKLVLTNQLQLA
jgi:hypothetical protein